jgi:multidrug transporter EmrE-like cation transporter
MYYYAFALIGSIIESLASISFKHALKTNDYNFYYLGLIGYLFTGVFFFQLLKYYKLATANIIWHLFHFFILFIVSVYQYKEHYSTKELIGFLFAIISIWLLNDTHHH